MRIELNPFIINSQTNNLGVKVNKKAGLKMFFYEKKGIANLSGH